MTSQTSLRHRRHDRTKFTVCKPYERLRKRWQSLVDGTTGLSDSQRLDEDTAMSAQQKMVEHRESCEVCRMEDLALKVGELHEMLTASVG